MSADGSSPVQNPLTLVLTARSSQDYEQLKGIIEHVQSLPPEHNPIVAALNKLATVHFARFAFLGEEKVAVITTYDGDFDAYINEFVNEIGDVFNALLQHVEGGSPVPVQSHREEFLQFVRDNDRRCVGPFYSAYPDKTVLDITAAGAGVGS